MEESNSIECRGKNDLFFSRQILFYQGFANIENTQVLIYIYTDAHTYIMPTSLFYYLHKLRSEMNQTKVSPKILLTKSSRNKILKSWASQNDRHILSFVKAINVVGKKMTRNSLEMPNSQGCLIHFRSEFTIKYDVNFSVILSTVLWWYVFSFDFLS